MDRLHEAYDIKEHIKSSMKPFYKSRGHVEKSLYMSAPHIFNKIFKAAADIHINSYSLDTLIRNTIRRIEFKGRHPMNRAYVIFSDVPPIEPKIYLFDYGFKAMRNVVVGLALLSHELFHVFYGLERARWDISPKTAFEYSMEELSALLFEREIIMKFPKAHIHSDKLIISALEDVNKFIDLYAHHDEKRIIVKI